MSVDKPADTIKIWDSAIEFPAPPPDASTTEFKTAVETILAKVGSHKDALLALLRDAHTDGPKSASFDANRAWQGIEMLARLYCARERVKREALSSADREARCRAIADSLGQARGLIKDAMQSTPDVANDLLWAWWERTGEYADAAGQFVDLLYIEREFHKVVEGLAALETGAERAGTSAHKGRGRPRGTSVLPPDYINAMAGLYRRNTGSKPGAGDGPFARFVCAFLTAIGGRNIEDSTVVDAIKNARARARVSPSEWGPSPFDE